MKIRTTTLAAGLVFVLGTALSYAAPASENWENLCTKCHGADGKGLTKIGKKLSLKDYTDAKAQASFTDAEALKVILEGKEKMKGYKDKITEAEAKEQVKYIRAFKK